VRIPRYAVIPSNGRECLKQCVDAVLPQVDHLVIVIGSKEHDQAKFNFLPEATVFFWDGTSTNMNISEWWNNGLETATGMARFRAAPSHGKFDVAIINDDVIIPEGWFDAVAGTMRQMGVAAACSGGAGMPVLHTQNQAPPLATRMQGFAFILAGELGLRADEQFIWYCGDDDLGRRAAMAGGMVMIPNFHVNHLHPNGQVNDELAAAIPGDMQRYVDKWGGRPW
jgi:hypothetical protein